MSFGNAVIYSLLGICVVFFALALLMVMCLIILKYLGDKPVPQASENAAPAETAPAAEKTLAPGSAGDVKLYDTDPRDAALIMAIIADELKTPLNELRFKSIREVRE